MSNVGGNVGIQSRGGANSDKPLCLRHDDLSMCQQLLSVRPRAMIKTNLLSCLARKPGTVATAEKIDYQLGSCKVAHADCYEVFV